MSKSSGAELQCVWGAIAQKSLCLYWERVEGLGRLAQTGKWEEAQPQMPGFEGGSQRLAQL